MFDIGEELAAPVEDGSRIAVSGRRDTSRAGMFTEVLGWAVSNGIPISDAIKTLPFYDPTIRVPEVAVGRFLSFIRRGMGPFSPAAAFANTRWNFHLKMLEKELEQGEKLSVALWHHMRRHLPAYYITGVARAEEEGRLETALPLLARQMALPSMIVQERRAELIYISVRLIIMVQLFTFLAIKILPKFGEIFSSMLGRNVVVVDQMSTFIQIFCECVLLLMAFCLLLWKGGAIGEAIALRLPFIGRERRMFILTDLAAAMSCFLRQGDDIAAAAHWCHQSTRSYWLRNKLEAFTAEVSNGADWLEAWEKMRLGLPIFDWVIRNSAVRQVPAEGFELAGSWLFQEVLSTSRRIDTWLDPIATVCMCAIVGTVCYQMFSLLNSITASIVL